MTTAHKRIRLRRPPCLLTHDESVARTIHPSGILGVDLVSRYRG